MSHVFSDLSQVVLKRRDERLAASSAERTASPVSCNWDSAVVALCDSNMHPVCCEIAHE